MVLVDPLTAAVDLVIAPMAHIAPTAYASLHHRATTSSIALLTASFARSLIVWILTHATTAIAHPGLPAPTTTIRRYVCPTALENVHKTFNALRENIVTYSVIPVHRVAAMMPIAWANALVQVFARATTVANASPMAAVRSEVLVMPTASVPAAPSAPMTTLKLVLLVTSFQLATVTRAADKSVTWRPAPSLKPAQQDKAAAAMTLFKPCLTSCSDQPLATQAAASVTKLKR